MLQGPIEYWTHWNIEPFYFTWNLVFNSHVFLTVCNYYRYGVECSEICGYCLNKTNCHHINGLCLKGCDPSFQRDKCLGGTFFIVMNRVMAITWPYFVLRVERIDDKETKVLKMCVHLTCLYLWKKCAIKIIDKSLVFHLWMPRYKNLKEDGKEANDIHIFRSCIVLSRCACKVPNSRHKSFSWNKVHVNISSPSPLLTKVWIAETNYYRTNDHMTY